MNHTILKAQELILSGGKNWAKKRHPVYGISYKTLFKQSGGSSKMGVKTRFVQQRKKLEPLSPLPTKRPPSIKF
ncbi:MAG: hypothetical protein AAFY76_26885 [Cyanobacteria bacterium J06649_11]